MRLIEENYFQSFKRFITEGKSLEGDLSDVCDLGDECDLSDVSDLKKESDECEKCDLKKECDECERRNLENIKFKIKNETLTKKEKRDKESKKRSEERKRSWGITLDTDKDKVPSGYKELKSLSRGITEKRKKKPACTRPGEKGHNYFHDEMGKFSTKEKATSWSNDADYYGGNSSDCIGGKFKSDGKGRKLFTRQKCGRDSKGKKNQYVCKTSKKRNNKIKEDQLSNLPHLRGVPSEILIAELERRLDEGGMTTHQILSLCSRINAASSGQYPKKG